MYEAHFGLISKPFGTKAEGPAVFVGPRQAENIAGIHKGLAARDAVVTVTGPVGVGKTTVVNRALETIHPGRMAAWVGRMAISSEEVLELLLAGFGFKRKTNSTLQRFAAFRRLLHERAAAGIPVAIIIEDARKLGAAALAELEALTAADTADGGGANIILMGEPGLEEMLRDPELARLKQRIRGRRRVEPLSQAEVQGYLKHAIRAAGGNYDNIFGAGIIEIAAACAEGIPRILNTLCETALTTAMEAGENTVSAELMHQIAVDACGFEGALPAADTPADAPAAPTPPVEESLAVPETGSEEAGIDRGMPDAPGAAPPAMAAQAAAGDDIPESAQNIVVESGRYPLEPEHETEAVPEVPAHEALASHLPERLIVGDDEPTLTDIPELINDTQPRLDVLPESAAGGYSDQDSEDAFDLDEALLPQVESTNMMQAVSPNLDAVAGASESANRMPAVTDDLDEIAALDGGSQSALQDAPAISTDDLPTLSDSMRVNVGTAVEDAGTSLGDNYDEPAVTASPASEEVVPEETQTDQPGIESVEDPAPVMADPLTDNAPVIPEADLTALQAALDAVKTEDSADSDTPESTTVTAAEAAGEDIPEITLDQVIADQQTKNEEMDRFAEAIGNAGSLEEISDVMAETLFGVEFDEAAIAAVAMTPEPESAEDESVVPVASVEEKPAAETNVAGHDLDNAVEYGDPVEDSEVSPVHDNGLRESVAMRISVVNQMKDKIDIERTEAIEMGGDSRQEEPPPAKGPQPEPIERQINTSMTQTLEALNIAKAAEAAAEEKEEENTGGFFSRFLRSS